MTTIITIASLMLLTVASVCGNYAGEIDNVELPGLFDYSDKSRRTHAYIPRFSKKEKGKGISASEIHDDYYEHESTWVRKSDKQYKDSKKDKKEGKMEKKDKKGKNFWEEPTLTRAPAIQPSSSTAPIPSLSPVSMDSNNSGSKSEDMIPTAGSSEDCPPARPPTVIPPFPSSVSTAAPNSEIYKDNIKHVEIDLYAIDYTLFQTDRAPIKVDFLDLQKITEAYFRDHMVNSYKVSTQANLVDFTTSFVTAHFTPGEPVHIQYNSTAFFDEKSISIPTSETLSTVLAKSLENSKSYTDQLKSQLSEVNPFSSTTDTVFTDPKAALMTRSTTTRAKSVFGIAGAGVVMALTLTLFAGVARYRNRINIDDNEYNKTFSKQIRGDTTVAGETFVSDNNDSIYDSSISIFSSSGFVEKNEMRKYESSVKKKTNEDNKSHTQTSNDINAHPRRPRTVAEIENILSLEYDDII